MEPTIVIIDSAQWLELTTRLDELISYNLFLTNRIELLSILFTFSLGIIIFQLFRGVKYGRRN